MGLRKEERLFRQERIRQVIAENPALTAIEIAARFNVKTDAVTSIARKFGLQISNVMFFTDAEERKFAPQNTRNWGYLGECYRK